MSRRAVSSLPPEMMTWFQKLLDPSRFAVLPAFQAPPPGKAGTASCQPPLDIPRVNTWELISPHTLYQTSDSGQIPPSPFLPPNHWVSIADTPWWKPDS